MNDGWIDGWMDGWTDRWINGWIDECIEIPINRWENIKRVTEGVNKNA